MANLIETPTWEPGIYQLETEDPVLGGPDGIDNLQGKQLANRTAYLKAGIEQAGADLAAHVAAADPHPQYLTEPEGNALIAAAVAALVNSSPATLDTLSELANALGNDPNFATTLTALLALKAPLDSPALTGTPTAPTAAQFNNSAQLVNSAFVNTRGIQSRGITSSAVSLTLDFSHVGGTFFFGGAAAGQTVTMPSAANPLPAGGRIEIVNTNSQPITVAANGAETLYQGTGPVSSFILPSGHSVTLVKIGAAQWLMENWSFLTPAQFDNSKALATTEFVQRALGNLQGSTNIAVNTTATAADCGKVFSPTTTGLTLTLPLASAAVMGATIYVNPNGQGMTVAVQGGDTLTRPDNSTGSVVLNAIDYAVFRRTGIGWTLENCPAALKYMTAFGSSLAANGYQKLPSGLIIQWGTATEGVTTSFPIAFPNSAISITATFKLNAVNSSATNAYILSNSQFIVRVNTIETDLVYWIAIGY